MAASDAIPVPRKNTAYRFYFAIRKPSDSTLITTWAGQDSEVSLDGAAYSDCTNEATEIGTSGTGYIDLTSSEMNADNVLLKVTVTNTGAVPLVFVLYPESAGDYRVSDTQKVDVDTIKTNPVVNGGTVTFPTGATLASTTNITAGTITTVTTTTTATNVTTVNGLAAGVITATSIADDAITAAKIANGAIDAATFAADVDAEILSYLVDDATRIDASALNTASGTSIPAILADTNELQTDLANGGRIDLLIDAILEDTGTTIPATITTIDNEIAVIDSGVDTLLLRISEVLTVTPGGAVTVATILTDAITATALAASAVTEIQSGLATSASISALNNLSAAQVNSEVDTALADIHLDHLLAVDYDPASKPGVATALLNELIENDGGVSRYTANALEQAPSGGGGGGDPWGTSVPGSYTAGQAGFVLDQILDKTLLLGTGAIHFSSMVDTNGEINGPIVIGDDYLTADSRQFDWFIDPLAGVIGDYTCHFGGDANLSTGWRITGAMAEVTVDGDPKWRLRYEMVKAVSSLLTARNHRWSVEVRRSAIEMTKILGVVQVVPKHTAAV